MAAVVAGLVPARRAKRGGAALRDARGHKGRGYGPDTRPVLAKLALDVGEQELEIVAVQGAGESALAEDIADQRGFALL